MINIDDYTRENLQDLVDEMEFRIAELEKRAKKADMLLAKITIWGINAVGDTKWYRLLAGWKGVPPPTSWGRLGKLYHEETGLGWDSSSAPILYEWAKSKPDRFIEDENGFICEIGEREE